MVLEGFYFAEDQGFWVEELTRNWKWALTYQVLQVSVLMEVTGWEQNLGNGKKWLRCSAWDSLIPFSTTAPEKDPWSHYGTMQSGLLMTLNGKKIRQNWGDDQAHWGYMRSQNILCHSSLSFLDLWKSFFLKCPKYLDNLLNYPLHFP